MKVKIKMINSDVWEFYNDIFTPLEMFNDIVKSNFYVIDKDGTTMINRNHIVSVEIEN